MRSSNKSRNRNKNNNRRGVAGNNINRVFESAGPEGRVRGTPQQIIDKYLSLTYDAQLSGDRVAAENFQQHAEHYSRLLIEAQKEIAEKQSEQSVGITNSKTAPKTSETDQSERKLVDQARAQEDKVVDFDKNIEKMSNGSETVKEIKKPKKNKIIQRPAKKRTEESSETIEI